MQIEQEALAEACGVDERTIRNWESGKWPRSLERVLSLRLLEHLKDAKGRLESARGQRWLELRGQLEREAEESPARPTQLLGMRRLAGDSGPAYTFQPGREPVVFEDEEGRRYSQTLRGPEPQTLQVPDRWRLVQPTGGP